MRAQSKVGGKRTTEMIERIHPKTKHPAKPYLFVFPKPDKVNPNQCFAKVRKAFWGVQELTFSFRRTWKGNTTAKKSRQHAFGLIIFSRNASPNHAKTKTDLVGSDPQRMLAELHGVRCFRGRGRRGETREELFRHHFFLDKGFFFLRNYKGETCCCWCCCCWLGGFGLLEKPTTIWRTFINGQ